MTTEPIWITVADALVINQALVEANSEEHLVTDVTALEEAIDVPIRRFRHAKQFDLATIAARLIHGIGKAHAFQHKNAQTAWAVGRYFLKMNGYTLAVPRVPKRRAMVQTMIAKEVESLVRRDNSKEFAQLMAHRITRVDASNP